MPTPKPPERVTQDQAVQAERVKAYEAAARGGFIDQALEVEEFVRRIHSAIELETMDPRAIEGDDGY